MPSRDRASQALVRSQAGRCAGEHLTLLPLNEELRWTNTKLRTLLLRRLRQPLDLDWCKCKCGQPLDALGDHRAACSTVGVLAARAVPLERAWARVGREAGGRVKTNVYGIGGGIAAAAVVAALGGLGGGGAGWSGVGWPARLVAAAVAALAGVGRLVPAAVGARGRFCTC